MFFSPEVEHVVFVVETVSLREASNLRWQQADCGVVQDDLEVGVGQNDLDGPRVGADRGADEEATRLAHAAVQLQGFSRSRVPALPYGADRLPLRLQPLGTIIDDADGHPEAQPDRHDEALFEAIRNHVRAPVVGGSFFSRDGHLLRSSHLGACRVREPQ